MEVTFQAIGVIHTPIQEKGTGPIQSSRSSLPGEVEVFPEYVEGLEGISEFSHLYLLYHLDRADPHVEMMITPYLDDQKHGLFTTRYPSRPNPLGLSIVTVDRVDGGRIYFTGADMLDGTPLLDIKPYIPEFDVFEVTRKGWYEARKMA